MYQTLYHTTRRSWLVAAIIICSIIEVLFALTLLATDQQTHPQKLITQTLLYILPLVFVLQSACIGLTYVTIFETRTLKSRVDWLLILNIALCFISILATLVSLGLYVAIIINTTLYLLVRELLSTSLDKY